MTGMHSCSLPIQQGLNAPPPVVELDDDDDDEKKEKEMHINFDILSDDWMEELFLIRICQYGIINRMQ
jgi:hypothetical protein